MNDLKSQWSQLKSMVRMRWNKLTESDLSAIDGRCDQLARKIQERDGCSEDEAKRQVDQFCMDNHVESPETCPPTSVSTRESVALSAAGRKPSGNSGQSSNFSPLPRQPK